MPPRQAKSQSEYEYFAGNSCVRFAQVTENENNSVSANQEFKADADIVAGSIKVFALKRICIASNELQAKEGDLSFSPSDKYLAYSATEKNNSTKKVGYLFFDCHMKWIMQVPMTTYDRSEKYDYHYDMEYEQTGIKYFLHNKET